MAKATKAKSNESKNGKADPKARGVNFDEAAASASDEASVDGDPAAPTTEVQADAVESAATAADEVKAETEIAADKGPTSAGDPNKKLLVEKVDQLTEANDKLIRYINFLHKNYPNKLVTLQQWEAKTTG